MIRSAGIQLSEILKKANIGFDDSNLFCLEMIPDERLEKNLFPLIRIDGLPTNEKIYAGNQKLYETVSCQLNLWAKKNREIEQFHNLIEKLASTHEFECFFDTQDFDDNYQVHRLIMRFNKTQNIKEIV